MASQSLNPIEIENIKDSLMYTVIGQLPMSYVVKDGLCD